MATNESLAYKSNNGVAWLTFDRPQALNALNPETLYELEAVLDRVKTDDAVKGLIITGAGDAFSAGADIRYLSRSTPIEVRDFARLAVAVNHKIETLGKVVVAAINGYALGGGLELAEACMLRVAVRGAMLGHPEVRIGAVAGFGGTTRLPRLIGKGRAAELLLTGRLVTANEALSLGLVNQVVETDALLSQTETLMREILAQSPIAVKLTWQAIHHGLNLTLEESALLGAESFGLVAATDDFRTGTKAFLAKTAPSFTGR
ncbi:MAG TPA: enoyl-CoA hydratase-related protein [Candidatus Binatia bacterium]|nr:enoyl-CoA hydratase-related protein [Candidatus Binatia bacterium]